MNDKTYDVLKYIQRIGLPALMTLILTVGTACGQDMTVTGTIGSAIIAFLGVMLQTAYKIWEGKENESSI